MNSAQLLKGTALMVVVVLIWGTFLPVSKVVLRSIDPYYLTALRYGAAALVFLALTAIVEGPAHVRADGRARTALFYGTAGYCVFSILVFEGLRLSRPEHGAMILALTPVWVSLYQWVKSGQRPRAITLACIAVAMAGEALVVTRGDLARLAAGGDLFGNALILGASMAWTVYSLGVQRVPGWSPLRYSALCAGYGWLSIAAVTAIATLLGHAHPPSPSVFAPIAWELLYVVVVVSILAMLLWNNSVKLIGPLNASLAANFAPVITFGIAVWQGQALAGTEIAGASLVLAALIINNLANRRQMARAAAVANA